MNERLTCRGGPTAYAVAPDGKRLRKSHCGEKRYTHAVLAYHARSGGWGWWHWCESREEAEAERGRAEASLSPVFADVEIVAVELRWPWADEFEAEYEAKRRARYTR